MREKPRNAGDLHVSHHKIMSSIEQPNSPIVRYLGPLLPLGFGGFGVWLLVSGRYVFRPGRSNSEIVLLAPDAYIAGGFFIFLAALITALGVSGQFGRWLFWVGSIGSAIFLAIEAGRQVLGVAVYG